MNTRSFQAWPGLTWPGLTWLSLMLGMAFCPALAFGQKKEDIISLQRDVAQIEDEMRQFRKSVDEKLAALTALVQQSIDASGKTSAGMTAMQHSVDQKLSDQQTKLVQPVVTLGSKVDQTSDDVRSVRENVVALVKRMNDLDAKITDISSAVRTLSTPQTPPPGVPQNDSAGGSGTSPQAVPRVSAEVSYSNAYRDYMSKKDDLAIEEFAGYIRDFPDTANAPLAQFYIADIYYRNQDYKNAAKAYDAVIERFQKNPKTSDAQYMKACALMNDKQKTAAGEEFRNFIKTYPDHPKVKDAHRHLQELGMERRPAPSSRH